MAFSTTTTRDIRVDPKDTTFNAKVASSTGITAGAAAVLDGDVGLLVVKELPNVQWRFRVTSRPSAPGKMQFQAGRTITG